ncbi:disulfide bond formation protein B [Sphingomonas immobilis]|uniref:Disulfide bond formation protein B n=1 Tax=Sphingomonas immobilis TaxID=3063997 RepID=A0ABT8ZVT6_9SPHN|nr:disulfide bond formation protein B [Sphingomonas sp. CA1-15]MDO7841690.1 disulfide bond formation protein B [Sphingomonas sp. CA1-15]
MVRDPATTARALALAVPAALLGGAYAFQYVGGLYPCEMCWWQRYPLFVALFFAAFAFLVRGKIRRRLPVAIAGLAILVSGAIGLFHAGVEYHWWNGITACTTTMSGSGGSPEDMLKRLIAAPIIRCDVAQWRLFGISLAGFNALISIPAGLIILGLLTRRSR